MIPSVNNHQRSLSEAPQTLRTQQQELSRSIQGSQESQLQIQRELYNESEINEIDEENNFFNGQKVNKSKQSSIIRRGRKYSYGQSDSSSDQKSDLENLSENQEDEEEVNQGQEGNKNVIDEKNKIQQRQVEKKPIVLKEMTYSVYGENLEATLKLLSCQKSICLTDKKDPKSKRMFISAQCQPCGRSEQAFLRVTNQLSTMNKYQSIVYTSHLIDKNQKQSIVSKLKKCIDSISDLNQKYISIEDFKTNCIFDFVPQKRKEFNSLLNQENLILDSSIKFLSEVNLIQKGFACPKTKPVPSRLSMNYQGSQNTSKSSRLNFSKKQVKDFDIFQKFRYNFNFWLKNQKQVIEEIERQNQIEEDSLQRSIESSKSIVKDEMSTLENYQDQPKYEINIHGRKLHSRVKKMRTEDPHLMEQDMNELNRKEQEENQMKLKGGNFLQVNGNIFVSSKKYGNGPDTRKSQDFKKETKRSLLSEIVNSNPEYLRIKNGFRHIQQGNWKGSNFLQETIEKVYLNNTSQQVNNIAMKQIEQKFNNLNPYLFRQRMKEMEQDYQELNSIEALISNFYQKDEGIRPQNSLELRPRRFNEKYKRQREEARNTIDQQKLTQQQHASQKNESKQRNANTALQKSVGVKSPQSSFKAITPVFPNQLQDSQQPPINYSKSTSHINGGSKQIQQRSSVVPSGDQQPFFGQIRKPPSPKFQSLQGAHFIRKIEQQQKFYNKPKVSCPLLQANKISAQAPFQFGKKQNPKEQFNSKLESLNTQLRSIKRDQDDIITQQGLLVRQHLRRNQSLKKISGQQLLSYQRAQEDKKFQQELIQQQKTVLADLKAV